MVTWAAAPATAVLRLYPLYWRAARLPVPLAAGLAQNACKYFVTSTFCSSVPVCTEKSMNF